LIVLLKNVCFVVLLLALATRGNTVHNALQCGAWSTGDLVVPSAADATSDKLPLQPTTIAELLRAAGHFEALDADTSARDHELKLEAVFLNFHLSKYNMQREPGARTSSHWSFVLSDPMDAEQAFQNSKHKLK
jgi:hypothetical protein